MNLYEEKLSGFFGLPICREYRVRQRKKAEHSLQKNLQK